MRLWVVGAALHSLSRVWDNVGPVNTVLSPSRKDATGPSPPTPCHIFYRREVNDRLILELFVSIASRTFSRSHTYFSAPNSILVGDHRGRLVNEDETDAIVVSRAQSSCPDRTSIGRSGCDLSVVVGTGWRSRISASGSRLAMAQGQSARSPPYAGEKADRDPSVNYSSSGRDCSRST